MGYVHQASLIEHLKSTDPDTRNRAAEQMRDNYEAYRESMRSGLFGALIGKTLFTKRPRRK